MSSSNTLRHITSCRCAHLQVRHFGLPQFTEGITGRTIYHADLLASHIPGRYILPFTPEDNLTRAYVIDKDANREVFAIPYISGRRQRLKVIGDVPQDNEQITAVPRTRYAGFRATELLSMIDHTYASMRPGDDYTSRIYGVERAWLEVMDGMPQKIAGAYADRSVTQALPTCLAHFYGDELSCELYK